MLKVSVLNNTHIFVIGVCVRVHVLSVYLCVLECEQASVFVWMLACVYCLFFVCVLVYAFFVCVLVKSVS